MFLSAPVRLVAVCARLGRLIALIMRARRAPNWVSRSTWTTQSDWTAGDWEQVGQWSEAHMVQDNLQRRLPKLKGGALAGDAGRQSDH
jgi:hypothetical protein